MFRSLFVTVLLYYNLKNMKSHFRTNQMTTTCLCECRWSMCIPSWPTRSAPLGLISPMATKVCPQVLFLKRFILFQLHTLVVERLLYKSPIKKSVILQFFQQHRKMAVQRMNLFNYSAQVFEHSGHSACLYILNTKHKNSENNKTRHKTQISEQKRFTHSAVMHGSCFFNTHIRVVQFKWFSV